MVTHGARKTFSLRQCYPGDGAGESYAVNSRQHWFATVLRAIQFSWAYGWRQDLR